MAKRIPVEERFFAKVDRSGDCWTWTTPALTNGYGLFWFEGRMAKAHCVAYRLFVGPIPPGLELDHLCHTRDLSCPGGNGCPHRRCVRPDHLEPVTHRVNAARGRNSGREGVGAENAAKTRCPYDHEYTPENTYATPSGRRECRICRAVRKESAHPRSEGIPRLCLDALWSIGGSATTTEILRQLRASGGQSSPVRVATALGRLADRAQPLVVKTHQGTPGRNSDPSAWEITDAGHLLLVAKR